MALTFCLVDCPVSALAQSITLIGGLPNETFSLMYTVSADGLKAAGLSLGPSNLPLKWTAPNTLTVLGSVPNGVGGLASVISAFHIGTLPSGTKSTALAVSADVSAAAGVSTIGLYDHAFRCPGDVNGDGYVDDAHFVLFANAYDNLVCP